MFPNIRGKIINTSYSRCEYEPLNNKTNINYGPLWLAMNFAFENSADKYFGKKLVKITF